MVYSLLEAYWRGLSHLAKKNLVTFNTPPQGVKKDWKITLKNHIRQKWPLWEHPMSLRGGIKFFKKVSNWTFNSRWSYMRNSLFPLSRGVKTPKNDIFHAKIVIFAAKNRSNMVICTFFSILMDGKYILYVLGQFYGIETNFCGKGVLKTRENGHFWPFLRLLRNFSPLKPP